MALNFAPVSFKQIALNIFINNVVEAAVRAVETSPLFKKDVYARVVLKAISLRAINKIIPYFQI